MNFHTRFSAISNRRVAVQLAAGAIALLILAIPQGADAKDRRATVTIPTVSVADPGNPSVAIVPFTDAIYQSCADAPSSDTDCLSIGGVDYRYGIGRLEVTVKQWVAFLNTVDPSGRDRHDLYSSTESSTEWPRFGQINMKAKAKRGRHYSVAYPEWADKPYGFANFLRAARFVNALENGRVVSKTTSEVDGVRITKRKVRLSSKTGNGMYDLSRRKATRSKKSGFVLPSQDEWAKAAYYDPTGGGTYSYWKYPTNAGVFGDGDATAPSPSILDPTTGDVTNAATQPLSTYHNMDLPAPSWCPAGVQPASNCENVNPFGIDPTSYAKAYAGSLGTVGQTKTLSPWGTLDQGGNVVEWTDTVAQSPAGNTKGRVWRRLHGGIANAPAYQLWLSAVGLQPQDNAFFTATYPWLGIRVGVIGNPK